MHFVHYILHYKFYLKYNTHSHLSRKCWWWIFINKIIDEYSNFFVAIEVCLTVSFFRNNFWMFSFSVWCLWLSCYSVFNNFWVKFNLLLWKSYQLFFSIFCHLHLKTDSHFKTLLRNYNLKSVTDIMLQTSHIVHVRFFFYSDCWRYLFISY